MTDQSMSSLELTVGLPLDVVADKLRRLETELRVLNMKAITAAAETNGLGARMETRVDAIYEALDSIRRLVSDIEADIQPNSATGPALKGKLKADRDD